MTIWFYGFLISFWHLFKSHSNNCILFHSLLPNKRYYFITINKVLSLDCRISFGGEQYNSLRSCIYRNRISAVGMFTRSRCLRDQDVYAIRMQDRTDRQLRCLRNHDSYAIRQPECYATTVLMWAGPFAEMFLEPGRSPLCNQHVYAIRMGIYAIRMFH